MAVYVDALVNYGWVMRGKQVASCHMIADTLEELHTMALAIGMKLAWFQMSKGDVPHYDLTASRRRDAIAKGAKEISRAEFCKHLEKYRKK